MFWKSDFWASLWWYHEADLRLKRGSMVCDGSWSLYINVTTTLVSQRRNWGCKTPHTPLRLTITGLDRLLTRRFGCWPVIRALWGGSRPLAWWFTALCLCKSICGESVGFLWPCRDALSYLMSDSLWCMEGQIFDWQCSQMKEIPPLSMVV